MSLLTSTGQVAVAENEYLDAGKSRACGKAIFGLTTGKPSNEIAKDQLKGYAEHLRTWEKHLVEDGLSKDHLFRLVDQHERLREAVGQIGKPTDITDELLRASSVGGSRAAIINRFLKSSFERMMNDLPMHALNRELNCDVSEVNRLNRVAIDIATQRLSVLAKKLADSPDAPLRSPGIRRDPAHSQLSGPSSSNLSESLLGKRG